MFDNGNRTFYAQSFELTHYLSHVQDIISARNMQFVSLLADMENKICVNIFPRPRMCESRFRQNPENNSGIIMKEFSQEQESIVE